MVRCEIIPLHQTKLGNEAAEFEDAFAFGPVLPHTNALGNGSGNGAPLATIASERAHIAIADGATESSFSATWATMLVRAYRKGEMQTVAALRERTKLLAQRWQHSLNFRKLPWYAEEKARLGAFSTLLGLTITGPVEAADGAWQALAVGDSCLFHLRDDTLIESFPIRCSHQFGNSPSLLSSNVVKNAPVWDNVTTTDGTWETGSTFILATDALACWLLMQHERGHHPWQEVLRIADHAHADGNEFFAAWVAECRAHWGMKNDDVTCLVVRLRS